MSGFFYRLKPVDFRMKSMLGAPAGSTVVDWPIRYEDLAPVLRAGGGGAWRLRRAVTATPSPSRGGSPIPLPPLAEHPIAKEIDRAGKSGVHPYPTARAINSRPYRGRAGCIYCVFCGSSVARRREVQHPGEPHPARARHREGRAAPAAAWPAPSRWTRRAGEERGVPGREGRRPASSRQGRGGLLHRGGERAALLNSQLQPLAAGLANGSGLVGKNLVVQLASASPRHVPHRKQKPRWPWLEDPAPFVQRSLQDYYLLRTRRWLPQGRDAGLHVDAPHPISRPWSWRGTGKSGVFGKALKDRFRVFRDSRDSPVRDLRRVPPHARHLRHGAADREGQVRHPRGGDHRGAAPAWTSRSPASWWSAARRSCARSSRTTCGA